MKYKYNGQWYDVSIKALDSMPVGSEIDFNGNTSDIPVGWEQSDNVTLTYKQMNTSTNIDNLKTFGFYGIFNATGTLPTGYSTSDNNIIIECIMWANDYGRQILHDVRNTNTYVRNLFNGTWQNWVSIT